jgi:hypothetical protein
MNLSFLRRKGERARRKKEGATMALTFKNGVCTAVLRAWVAFASIALFGCAQTPPPATTVAPSVPTTASPGLPEPSAIAVLKPSETPPPPPPAAAATAISPIAPMRASAATIATTAALTPAGVVRYRCATGSAPNESRSPIELPAGSERVCSRFPAMGPCQYERDACRAKGGRVIRFDDVEITKDIEREYDKQVQRFRLNAG